MLLKTISQCCPKMKHGWINLRTCLSAKFVICFSKFYFAFIREQPSLYHCNENAWVWTSHGIQHNDLFLSTSSHYMLLLIALSSQVNIVCMSPFRGCLVLLLLFNIHGTNTQLYTNIKQVHLKHNKCQMHLLKVFYNLCIHFMRRFSHFLISEFNYRVVPRETLLAMKSISF